MLIRFTSIVSCITLVATSVNAYGMIAQVVDANDFCVFLPPDDATDRIISDSEWNANAFCMGTTPLAKNSGTLPSGFIKSAHYVKTDAYVQVTGQMDYTKANLVGSDGGGQMDIKASVGSSCAGWSYYVNLIEPESNTYCMRCCNDTTSCNRGISEKGCAHIIPGDYSGPNDDTDAGVSSSADSESSTTASVAATTAATELVASSTASVVPSSIASVVPSPVLPSAVSSPVVSSAFTSATQSSSSSAPTDDVTAQGVSSASSNAPMKLAIGAGLLAFAVTFV
ncbi:hypothetical protein INT48_008734 [Thamnidium elegans]|uniref:Secreted protein n=1 Tax=Thamnidium elegans TaxID=101142 RepID=A0A8H7SF93_9FUNG|nr:hypothetical protein INT48_008734 [Thamnidium elegans]